MIVDIILRLIDGLEHELKREYERLFRHYPRHPRCRHNQKVKQVLITVINNQTFIFMDPIKVRKDKGFHVVDGLVDADTLQPIAGATKVLKSRTVSDETIAFIDDNGDLIPKALGVATLTSVNTWSYPDRDNPGQFLSSDQTTTKDFQVILGPEGILQTVDLVQFDLPPAQPETNA